MVAIICPCTLVGIGLTELHNSGWTKGYSAQPLVASLLFKGLALIMLVAGSTNNISVKYMDQEKSENSAGKIVPFNHPLIQAWNI